MADTHPGGSLKKPRSRSTYDNTKESRGFSGIPLSDRTLNEKLCAVSLVTHRSKEGPTYFRPFPALDPEDPQNGFLPGRTGIENHAQSEWIVGVWCAHLIGFKDRMRSFCLYPPGTERERQVENPWHIFYYGCRNALKAKQFSGGGKWNPNWDKYVSNDYALEDKLIGPPSRLWFVQGVCYKNGQTNHMDRKNLPKGFNDDDPLVVIQLKDYSGRALMDILDRKKKDFQGNPLDRNCTAGFAWGDPVGTFDKAAGVLNGGLIMAVYNGQNFRGFIDQRECPELREWKVGTSWNGQPPGAEGKRQIWKHEMGVSSGLTINGIRHERSFNDKLTKIALARTQYWFDNPADPTDKGLLRIEPYAAQYEFIAEAFKPEPHLYEYAFADVSDPENAFSAHIKGILGARTTSTPGTDANGKTANPGRASRRDPTAPPADEGLGDEEGARTEDQASGEDDPPPGYEEETQVEPGLQEEPSGNGEAAAEGDADTSDEAPGEGEAAATEDEGGEAAGGADDDLGEEEAQPAVAVAPTAVKEDEGVDDDKKYWDDTEPTAAPPAAAKKPAAKPPAKPAPAPAPAKPAAAAAKKPPQDPKAAAAVKAAEERKKMEDAKKAAQTRSAPRGAAPARPAVSPPPKSQGGQARKKK
jgi:hypothetical protein